MIVPHAVYVIEDHPRRAALPDLSLAAYLALGLLQPLLIKASLHMLA